MEPVRGETDSKLSRGQRADEKAYGLFYFGKRWTPVGSIVWRIVEELAKKAPAEMGRVSARGLPRHLEDVSGVEAEDLGGSLARIGGKGGERLTAPLRR